MNRSNFFKNLLTLIASPSIIGEIDWDKKPSYPKVFKSIRIADIPPDWAYSYVKYDGSMNVEYGTLNREHNGKVIFVKNNSQQ